MNAIQVTGIVGAGTMGSALAQKFAQEGFRVLLADQSESAVSNGMEKIRRSLREGVDRKVFTEGQMQAALHLITGTHRLEDLKSCDLIVEAIYENAEAKMELFRKLCGIVSNDAILATNTSSFSVTELAASVKNPSRFLGLHYFYHAAKNRLVEIVPGKETSAAILKEAYRFSVLSGKDPIFTKDVYGFAVNRFFVPWLNESVRLQEEGIASMEQIDEVGKKILGIGMGPFALMNATGVPVARHAQQTFEVFGPSYKVAALLDEQVKRRENWAVDTTVMATVDAQTEKAIHDRMMGAVFFICSRILEEEICSAVDLNKGAKIGLRWRKGPVELMMQYGEAEVERLVKAYANRFHEVPPKVMKSKWFMEVVTLRKEKDRAIITLNRPEDLNALNESMIRMLDEKFSSVESDPEIKIIFLVGSGKAFAAGADIRFFVQNMKNHTIGNITTFTAYSQQVFDRIDRSSKKVIAILNGMALGGGLELALCADLILSVPKTTVSFPETGIGIFPGLGGTWRCAERVGKALAKFLILTGKTLHAAEAEEIGLIDLVLPAWEMFELIDGIKPLPVPVKRPKTGKWLAYETLYSNNHFSKIITGDYTNGYMERDEVIRLGNVMGSKAPVAMKIADQLIEESGGPKAELEKLDTVFSTEDALLGLTNIGKKVIYSGK